MPRLTTPPVKILQGDIVSAVPKFGVNYKPGYIAGTFDDASLISHGIALMCNADRFDHAKVSHSLVVTGENKCVEAIMGKGVIESDLRDYFDDPHKHIFFRKPKLMTDLDRLQVVSTANQQIGASYANRLIVVDFFRGTLWGRLLDRATNKKLFDKTAQLVQKKGDFICSQLAAFSLKAAEKWSLKNEGILKRPPAAITPQALTWDKVIYTDLKNPDELMDKWASR